MLSYGEFCEAKYSELMGLDGGEISRFLGKSVVRTPVYHGTNARFSQFEKLPTKRYVLFTAFDVQAQGFFFAEKKQDAKGFGSRVITAYVRMENPFVDPRRDANLGVSRLDAKREAQLAYMLRNMFDKRDGGRGFDLMVNRVWVKDDFAKEKDYSWVYNVIDSGGLKWDVLDHPGVVATMRRLGYDGTFVHEPDSYAGRSIFVMDPDQIKIVSVS